MTGTVVVAGTVVVGAVVVVVGVVVGAVVVVVLVVATVVVEVVAVLAVVVAPIAGLSAGADAAPTTKSTTPTAPAISFRGGTTPIMSALEDDAAEQLQFATGGRCGQQSIVLSS